MNKILIVGAMIMSLSNLAQADQHAITQVIHHYADATASRDAATISRLFHDDFRVIALTEEGPRVLDKSQYLTLLKDEKIGGVARTLAIKHINVQDKTAHANVSLTSEKAVFHDQLHLIQTPEGWQIINNLTQVTPASN
jgi:ketosteroid isomerase-like protein